MTLVGWNDLGMHCMDADYSVMAILPPYNTIHAQLIDSQGNMVTVPNGVTVTFNEDVLFSDDFETGDTSGWSATIP